MGKYWSGGEGGFQGSTLQSPTLSGNSLVESTQSGKSPVKVILKQKSDRTGESAGLRPDFYRTEWTPPEFYQTFNDIIYK